MRTTIFPVNFHSHSFLRTEEEIKCSAPKNTLFLPVITYTLTQTCRHTRTYTYLHVEDHLCGRYSYIVLKIH